MKLIIIAAMASVLVVAPVMAKSHHQHHHEKPLCPTPTTENSGLVGEDSNHDGYIDHVWRVYTSGQCAMEVVKSGNF